jgi:pSer/pThr/pTyr-binding forkhead associated (FHA) protein
VRLFVLQAAGNTLTANPADLQAPMVTLAQNSGGQYVELNTARDYMEDARGAFAAIRPVDHTYALTYRSANGDSGERRIAVSPAEQPELTGESVITLNLLPPAVDGANLVIGPVRDGRRELSAPVAWPDGFAREIRAVSLNDEPVAAEDYTYADDRLRLTLDESVTGNLQVVVEDELGLSAGFAASIDTPAPPPTATSAPPTPVPTPVAPPAPANPLAGALPWIGLGGIAVAAAGLYVAARRGALARLGQKDGEGTPRVKTIGTARDQKQALAYLLVLTGREDLIGQNIPLYNEITTIGRDPQLTDIQLYHPHELSSISGQHCTIQVDHGLFLIIDNNSANGTFVNGAALMPDMPHQLQDGDEIVLGDKAQRGAQLRFEVSQRARNRYYETVIEADWQGGDRSGTETVTGPPKTNEAWSDTSPLQPSDGAPDPLSGLPSTEDQPPAAGSAG